MLVVIGSSSLQMTPDWATKHSQGIEFSAWAACQHDKCACTMFVVFALCNLPDQIRCNRLSFVHRYFKASSKVVPTDMSSGRFFGFLGDAESLWPHHDQPHRDECIHAVACHFDPQPLDTNHSPTQKQHTSDMMAVMQDEGTELAAAAGMP